MQMIVSMIHCNESYLLLILIVIIILLITLYFYSYLLPGTKNNDRRKCKFGWNVRDKVPKIYWDRQTMK